jgi:hypothetical protein
MTFPSKCLRVALNENSLPAVREWATTLRSRADEVLATLEDEGVVVEAVFLEHAADGDYLIYFIKGENLAHANEVAAKSTHAIDEYHRHFQSSHLGKRTRLEMLIDSDRIQWPFSTTLIQVHSGHNQPCRRRA